MPDPKIEFDVRTQPLFQDVINRMKSAEEAMNRSFRRGLELEGRRLRSITQREAPKKTGEYAGGIDYSVEGGRSNFLLRITGAAPLSTFIVKGTKPHKIFPRNASVLAFDWPNGPQGPGMYFFRSVDHPGTKPNKFHERALRRWMPGANKLLGQAMSDYQAAALGGSS